MATEQLNNEQINALVAEKVMGWKRWTCANFDWKEAVLTKADLQGWTQASPSTPLSEYGAATVPQYTTDPAADYAVLRHVRETWTTGDLKQWHAFVRACHHIWRGRTMTRAGWWAYQPGDYARAALAALEQQGEPEGVQGG